MNNVNVYYSLEAFAHTLPVQGRLLALDVGSKRIGLALSDVLRTLATPMQVLQRVAFHRALDSLKAIIHEHHICALVVGLPLNLDDTHSASTQAARAYGANAARALGLPVLMWDERHSTVIATEVMMQAESSLKTRIQKIDAVAASVILQSALDGLGALSAKAGGNDAIDPSNNAGGI